ncbi:MAG TPA: hypothetical protein VKC90_04340 [Chitinophagaceae bacterium]|nr:hypothetical protein [Chitinophagaceae bacterium]
MDQLWFYSYSSHVNESDSLITPASFMNLQSDGLYTRDFGDFEQGNWKQKDAILFLKSKTGTITEFPIKSFFGAELQLVSPSGTLLNFESQPRRFSSAGDNPFSGENNLWRMPAAKKENEQEIKNRLKNHFRFYELYFSWALNNHFQSIDVNSAPSLIKIYGNGFELKSGENLPEVWRNYFYDQEDCNKANELIKNIFEHHEISWANTDNKFKMFISAFQQLQQQLR